MAYGHPSGFRKSRPVLATAIARAAAPSSRGLGHAAAASSTASSFWMHHRDLRQYRDRILILLVVAAVYTFYIVQSGMS
jgi:hypothetical protein